MIGAAQGGLASVRYDTRSKLRPIRRVKQRAFRDFAQSRFGVVRDPFPPNRGTCPDWFRPKIVDAPAR